MTSLSLNWEESLNILALFNLKGKYQKSGSTKQTEPKRDVPLPSWGIKTDAMVWLYHNQSDDTAVVVSTTLP